MKVKTLKFTKNHRFHGISRKHGNGRFSRLAPVSMTLSDL